jgi:hypothetical protein
VTIFINLSHPLQDHKMDCQSCATLLTAYKYTVSLYTTSVSKIKALAGDGFFVPYSKTKSLQQARRYRQQACMAYDALMAHWLGDHNGLKCGTRNGFSLVSQEAEQLRQSRRHADDTLILIGGRTMAT